MTHQHTAVVSWRLAETPEVFRTGKYTRRHTWTFDGGVVVPGSPAPSVVREPLSDASAVDPEEAFVASLSSCHMLTFLYVAQKAGFVVRAYDDHAAGAMAKSDNGSMWVSDVTLNVRVEYAGERAPTEAEEDALHHKAHEQCFIANSVKTRVVVKKV